MPSKSVSFDDDLYRYLNETSDEGEFSERVRELCRMGKEMEESREGLVCQHCGQEFGNQGAKSTHERNCPEAPE